MATVLVVTNFGLNLRTCDVVMVSGKMGEYRLVQVTVMLELTRIQLKGVSAAVYQSIVMRM